MAPKLKILKPESTALEALISDYQAHKRIKWSPRTVDLNANVLEKTFLTWCRKADISAPEQLDQRALDRWTRYLMEEHRTPNGKPLANASIKTYVRTLASMIKFAQEQNAVGPKVKLQQPRAEKRVLETLDRAEIRKLEDAANTERDRLIIRLLADSGVRLGELLGLRPGDMVERGRERYIKVKGKGSRERLVPLTPMLFQRLRRYAGRGGDRIFVTNRRSPKTGEHEPLAARSVQNMLKFTAQEAGVERHVHPHAFRHSYATHALRRGMNVVTLQHIMGWSSLEMLKVYEHLTASDSYTAMLDLLRADD